jgi:hypothetical protein
LDKIIKKREVLRKIVYDVSSPVRKYSTCEWFRDIINRNTEIDLQYIYYLQPKFIDREAEIKARQFFYRELLIGDRQISYRELFPGDDKTNLEKIRQLADSNYFPKSKLMTDEGLKVIFPLPYTNNVVDCLIKFANRNGLDLFFSCCAKEYSDLADDPEIQTDIYVTIKKIKFFLRRKFWIFSDECINIHIRFL